MLTGKGMFQCCTSLVVGYVLFFTSAASYGHGGGLDANGGHFNQKTAEYHCHRSPCGEVHRQVEKATQEALDRNRMVSKLYDRSDWPHWIDADNDCQDTRAEILIRDSQVPAKYKRNKPCNVTWGKWFDLYTGILFLKASDMDIDHIVPLHWAHSHSGAAWTRDRKREFANDYANLIPADAETNREKSDKGPDQWMPPRKTYHCEYVKRFNAIVSKYGLVYTGKEQMNINSKLALCSR